VPFISSPPLLHRSRVKPLRSRKGVRLKQRLLTDKEVLSGYDAVSRLYPHIIPMCLWRAWEYAAYRHLDLPEPILDLGCGDGRFFRLAWPKAKKVIGIDIDPGVIHGARNSGIYQMVYMARAHQIPVPPQRFKSVLANCSLEHMDHLPEVLKGVAHILDSQGTFVLSVVTENFMKWASLPFLLENLGLSEKAREVSQKYRSYHHTVNAFPPGKWMDLLTAAGFQVVEQTPIVPELTSRLCLFWDNLWHVQHANQELGGRLYPFLQELPRFTEGFREILKGVLKMEPNWSTGSGVVVMARKRRS